MTGGTCEPTPEPRFVSAAGLRALLVELHRDRDQWHGAEARELLVYCADRYSGLAHKYGQTGNDAAAAAFEVLRAAATRWARDPWGVVTAAVARTLQAEHRAHALLCGVEQARHLMHAPVHDATRFADRELIELDPVFHVLDTAPDDPEDARRDDESSALSGAGWTVVRGAHADFVAVHEAMTLAVSLFVQCGWPSDAARTALEAICSRLVQAGQRRRAFEYLRRHRDSWAQLDLTHRQWTRVLTVVLGAPQPDMRDTDLGRGLLWRLLAGQPREELLLDQRVTHTLAAAAPACLEVQHV